MSSIAHLRREYALASLDRVPYPKSEGQRLINSILKDVA